MNYCTDCKWICTKTPNTVTFYYCSHPNFNKSITFNVTKNKCLIECFQIRKLYKKGCDRYEPSFKTKLKKKLTNLFKLC